MLQLTPSAIKTARENLKAYIEQAKTLDVMKSKYAPIWGEPNWNVSEFTKRPNETADGALLKFGSTRPTRNVSENKAIHSQGMIDLMKAVIAYRLDFFYGRSRRPAHGTISTTLTVVRKLIEALEGQHGAKCLTDAPAWQFEEYLSGITDPSAFSKVRKILVELRDLDILPQISGLPMKIPPKKAVGAAATSAREPTTWDEIVALGSAFHKAAFAPGHELIHPKVRFWTSCATLLATTPSRETELWRLPVNLEVVNNPASTFGSKYTPLMHEDQSFKYGLRWWPAKGGAPLIKFVPSPMVKVAQRAIEIIKEHTDEPRRLARWIIENPGKLPIPEEHSDIEECRKTGVISVEQIERLFGVVEHQHLANVTRWKKRYKRTKETRIKSGNARIERLNTYDFKVFVADWAEDFRSSFPSWPLVVDDDSLQLRADEALMVCFQGELDSRVVNKSKIFLEIPKQSSFSNALSGSETKNGTNLFEDLDIRLPDGTCARIQSHDLRHFLNTMAQRAGVPQKIIAAWSGRKDIGQNMVYDHRTDAERVEAIGAGYDYDELTAEDLLELQMGVFRGEVAPPSTTVLSAQQSNFNEVRKKLFVSITQGGFCLGDLYEDPCPSAQNCISCSRHMVCGGSEKANAIFREKARIMNRQHDELKKQLEVGRPGITEEHVEHMADQCQGANEMLLALNDPETEDGTLIRRADYIGAQRTQFTDRVIEHRAERLALAKEGREISNG